MGARAAKVVVAVGLPENVETACELDADASVANAGDDIYQSAVCGNVHFIKKDGSACPASK